MLLGTVLLLIDNIERSFNAIWQVKKPRGLFRQITDYSSLILLLPVLLVVSSGLSIFMSTYVKELQNFMVLAPVLKFFVRLIPYAYLGNVYRTLHLHAQHQGKTGACLATGYSGRKCFSGLPVFLHQQPDMGF